jgi:hypothetical protein
MSRAQSRVDRLTESYYRFVRLINIKKRTCVDQSDQLLDCRQSGSYPETGFEEVGEIGTDKSA